MTAIRCFWSTTNRSSAVACGRSWSPSQTSPWSARQTTAAAITQARRTRPDVVLMDVRMPRVDGIAATWRLPSSTTAAERSSWCRRRQRRLRLRRTAGGGARVLFKRSSADDFVNAIRTVTTASHCSTPTAIRGPVTHHSRQDAAASPRRTSPSARTKSCGCRPGPVRLGNRGPTVPQRRDRQTHVATSWRNSAPGAVSRLLLPPREWLPPLTPPSRLPIRSWGPPFGPRTRPVRLRRLVRCPAAITFPSRPNGAEYPDTGGQILIKMQLPAAP